MHRSHADRRVARPIRTCVLTYAAGLSALWAVAAGSASAQVASDSWITHQVKTMLLVSESVNAMQMHVDTTEGRVTL